ncbi:hypothetical protein D3C84_652150 [compost metagenome]
MIIQVFRAQGLGTKRFVFYTGLSPGLRDGTAMSAVQCVATVPPIRGFDLGSNLRRLRGPASHGEFQPGIKDFLIEPAVGDVQHCFREAKDQLNQ